MGGLTLAHGVGTVYELPIPLSWYLTAAAAVVVAAFAIRASVKASSVSRPERLVMGRRAIANLLLGMRALAVVALVATVLVGVVLDERGFSAPTLLFWLGLVLGALLLSALMGGAWERVDPWATLERAYRVDGAAASIEPPWWLGPLLVYALFWFELVSGVGFESFGVALALLIYTLYAASFRHRFGPHWALADPFSILFGFASRVAPTRVADDGLVYRGLLGGLDEPHPMPKALYASLFVLLGSTTLDNVRETIGWTQFREATGLDALPTEVVDSLALLVFAALFFLPFALVVRWSRTGLGGGGDVGPRLVWSLIPIGIVYVLAHNAPLLIVGIPELIRDLSDPLEKGWNLFGTARVFSGFIASPRVVWFIEIALIVGGHVMGVVAAHRIALRLAGSHAAAVRSQIAVTALMSIYTIVTLWLLAQPLVD